MPAHGEGGAPPTAPTCRAGNVLLDRVGRRTATSSDPWEVHSPAPAPQAKALGGKRRRRGQLHCPRPSGPGSQGRPGRGQEKLA